MAIRISDKYPGDQSNPPDSNYPGGSFKDVSTPGGTDGTPYQELWPNDLQGLFQKIIKNALITPSDVPDTALVSDYFDGLAKLFNRALPYNDTGIANAYVLSPAITREPLTAYYDGLICIFKVTNANTGPSTVNMDTIGAVALVNSDGSALTGGELQDNSYCISIYRSTGTRFEIIYNSINLGTLDDIYNRIIAYNDNGTGNAYDLLVAKGSGYSAYSTDDEIIVIFKATHANTGATTMSLDGLASNPLTQADGSALSGGEISINDYLMVRRNNTATRFEIMLKSGGGAAATTLSNVGGGSELVKALSGSNYPIRTMQDSATVSWTENADTLQANVSIPSASIKLLHVQDVKAGAPQTITTGAYRTRDLNTVVANTITGASLAANQVTLPAGDYLLWALSGAQAMDVNNLRWYNITDASTDVLGLGYAVTPASGNGNPVTVEGYFSIAASKVFELQHRCQTTGTGGNTPSWETSIVYSKVIIIEVSIFSEAEFARLKFLSTLSMLTKKKINIFPKIF